jgi:hypothetical protein
MDGAYLLAGLQVELDEGEDEHCMRGQAMHIEGANS